MAFCIIYNPASMVPGFPRQQHFVMWFPPTVTPELLLSFVICCKWPWTLRLACICLNTVWKVFICVYTMHYHIHVCMCNIHIGQTLCCFKMCPNCKFSSSYSFCSWLIIISGFTVWNLKFFSTFQFVATLSPLPPCWIYSWPVVKKALNEDQGPWQASTWKRRGKCETILVSLKKGWREEILGRAVIV